MDISEDYDINIAVCMHPECNRPATSERLISVAMIDCVGDGELFTSTVDLYCEDHFKDPNDS